MPTSVKCPFYKTVEEAGGTSWDLEYESLHSDIKSVDDFIKAKTRSWFIDRDTEDVYDRYLNFCRFNNWEFLTKMGFSRKVCQRLQLISKQKMTDGYVGTYYKEKES
jgi:hypothetical protein